MTHKIMNLVTWIITSVLTCMIMSLMIWMGVYLVGLKVWLLHQDERRIDGYSNKESRRWKEGKYEKRRRRKMRMWVEWTVPGNIHPPSFTV
jgi:hypothetical protein